MMSPEKRAALEPRVINGINYIGVWTFINREVERFMKVYIQTILAPAITTLLFYTVFALAFGGVTREINGMPFLQFLAPGLIMMSMIQNSFANTSSSIIISKVQGNIVDILMPPLWPGELVSGYLVGGIVRGLTVGLSTGVAMALFAPFGIEHLGVVLLFALFGTSLLAFLGILAGLWSESFDQMSAITNFIITPLAFLSGTFYNVDSLPTMWQGLAHYNPFFYMIDGFRYGFIGQADSNLVLGALILLTGNIVLALACWLMVCSGYKVKN